MQNLNQIRFVTAHYQDLQGLRWVLWGVICFAVAAEDAGVISTVMLLSLILPVGVALFFGVAHYYEKVLGSVVGGEGAKRAANTNFIFTAVLISARLLDDILEVRPMLSPFAFALWFLAVYWFLGRPYRTYYVWIAIAISATNVCLALVDFPAGSPWLRTGVVTWSLISVALIASGVLDHDLLMRTLKPKAEARSV